MNKKKEHAAIVVQRTWRKVKQQREYKRAQRGEYKPEIDYEKTPQDIQRIQENQDFKEQTQMNVRKAFPDTFYTKPIDDDTKKSLQEQIDSKRKLKSNEELRKLSYEEIYEQYNSLLKNFYGSYDKNEKVRAFAHEQII